MKKLIERLISTNDDAGLLIARTMLGIVMIPHGARSCWESSAGPVSAFNEILRLDEFPRRWPSW